MAHIFNEMRQLLPVAKNLTRHPQNKKWLSLKLTAEIFTIVVTLLTEDLLLRLQLVQCSSAEWTWHTFSMKWGNFCPWPKISLAILKMNRNCLHWLRMPLMFLHPFHFPNFPFSSVLFNAQNNLLTSKGIFLLHNCNRIWNGNFYNFPKYNSFVHHILLQNTF